jgi:hypothetical protein
MTSGSKAKSPINSNDGLDPTRYTGSAMQSEPPNLIAIDQDDYHASRVGSTKDGMKFFATTPFIPNSRG